MQNTDHRNLYGYPQQKQRELLAILFFVAFPQQNVSSLSGLTLILRSRFAWTNCDVRVQSAA